MVELKNKEMFESPVGRILRFILEKGDVTVKDIEEGLKVTRNAVRVQLDSLVAQGLVNSRLIRNERGRPHSTYFVTEKGRDALPNQDKDLVKMLWSEVIKVSDPTLKQKFLEALSSKLAEEYETELKGVPEGERLNRFVELLNQRGITSEVKHNESGWNEYNCPFYSVAKDDPDVCKMELEMLKRVLGSTVERNEWMLNGSIGCKFKVLSTLSNEINVTNPVKEEK